MLRYIILLILTLPIILGSIVNIVAKYKLHRASLAKLIGHLVVWGSGFVVVVFALPVYNLTIGNDPFNPVGLMSIANIVTYTAIVYLICIVMYQQQRIDSLESTVNKLHSEVSIELSEK